VVGAVAALYLNVLVLIVQSFGKVSALKNLPPGGTRVLVGERVFLNLGTRATVPPIPGLADAGPLTNIELLELGRVPEHLVVLGGGYVGLEFAQAFRRFGSRVTVVERGPWICSTTSSKNRGKTFMVQSSRCMVVSLHSFVWSVCEKIRAFSRACRPSARDAMPVQVSSARDLHQQAAGARAPGRPER
jgi:hypothetical protein